MVYDSDKLVAQSATVSQPYALYTKSLLEGGDVRALTFKGGVNGVEGMHSAPQDEFDWVMGCVGLRDTAGKCSAACSTALQNCITSKSKKYAECLGAEGQTADPDVASACPVGCTPTWEMLTQSESPTLHATNANGFGAPATSACKDAQPSGSTCTLPAAKAGAACGTGGQPSPSPSASPSPSPSPSPSAATTTATPSPSPSASTAPTNTTPSPSPSASPSPSPPASPSTSPGLSTAASSTTSSLSILALLVWTPTQLL
ncbi:unnamed protein product [Polarella glacialis]|uniref:Uncharacterized protein n=1 Tax=Polarella glacialis TaxID=89957 RepID=A0A813I3A6_POLGL|nr:unnamed protein product [Polarella glacialis]